MPKGQHSRATMNLFKVFVCSIDKAQKIRHKHIIKFFASLCMKLCPSLPVCFIFNAHIIFKAYLPFCFLLKRFQDKRKTLQKKFWSVFCLSRRLPIFTRRFQRTIFGTSELNFCVRNGNRWNLTVIDTDRSDWTSITCLSYFVQCFLEGRAFKTE